MGKFQVDPGMYNLKELYHPIDCKVKNKEDIKIYVDQKPYKVRWKLSV